MSRSAYVQKYKQESLAENKIPPELAWKRVPVDL